MAFALVMLSPMVADAPAVRRGVEVCSHDVCSDPARETTSVETLGFALRWYLD